MAFGRGSDARKIKFGPQLPEPADGWVPACLISFGEHTHCLQLVREKQSTFWFLDRNFSLVENVSARFLVSSSMAIDGLGPLDWAVAAVRTDGLIEKVVQDLHALIEEFVLASSGLPDVQTRILVGPEAAKESAAALDLISLLNRPEGGAPQIFHEMITKEIVNRGALQADLADGTSLKFDIFLPVVNFWYVGFSSDPANSLCVLITDHTKIAVALFDARANLLYSRFHPGNVYVDPSVILRVRLWRNYLHSLLASGRLRATRVGLAFRDSHIGHYIWNELSAVDVLSRMGRAASVFIYPECNEPGFSVDVVFPDIAGHVHRNVTSSLPHLLAAIAGDVAFFPFMSYQVSQRLADRLSALSRQEEPDLVQSFARIKEDTTLVLIGLRLENRTWIRQRQGYSALIRRLGQRKAERFLVIFDGHNVFTGPAGGYLTSFREADGESHTLPPLVRQEINLVDQVCRQAVEDRVNNVEILNLVPCSVSASIVAALAADFLVTHWGAGLAKYKWVANAHGCIFSARSVLSGGKGDIRIYDTGEFRENATPLIYYPHEGIRDLGSDHHAIQTGQPGRDDFDLDPEEFAEFIDRHIARRDARSMEGDAIVAG